MAKAKDLSQFDKGTIVGGHLAGATIVKTAELDCHYWRRHARRNRMSCIQQLTAEYIAGCSQPISHKPIGICCSTLIWK